MDWFSEVCWGGGIIYYLYFVLWLSILIFDNKRSQTCKYQLLWHCRRHLFMRGESASCRGIRMWWKDRMRESGSMPYYENWSFNTYLALLLAFLLDFNKQKNFILAFLCLSSGISNLFDHWFSSSVCSGSRNSGHSCLKSFRIFYVCYRGGPQKSSLLENGQAKIFARWDRFGGPCFLC